MTYSADVAIEDTNRASHYNNLRKDFFQPGYLVLINITGDPLIACGSEVVVPYNNKISDPNSEFNTTTHKFTPKVSGHYLVTARLVAHVSAYYYTYYTEPCYHNLFICKNYSSGNAIDSAIAASHRTGNRDVFIQSRLSGIVYLNGSTDYLSTMFFAYDQGSLHQTTTTENTFSAIRISI